MLHKEIIEKIESKHGKKLLYSSDCDSLSEHIREVTGERLSIATLKRMCGFTSQTVAPRRSSLDILAAYLGYSDYATMAKIMGFDSTIISDFAEADEIIASDIDAGTQIQITYQPDRMLVLSYLGESKFIVNEAYNTKIQKGDTLKITHFVHGMELFVSEVIRADQNLGMYVAAKAGGLTSIEIFN